MPTDEPDIFQSSPIGSLAFLDDASREQYAIMALKTAPALQELIFSARTASYINGVLKTHNVPGNKASALAFIVLRVCVGEVHLSKLAASISSELGLAADVSEKMAREIEHDLFAPVAGELSQYLASKKQQQATSASAAASQAGATNVLNLNQPRSSKPPAPPRPLPPRPPQIPRSGNKNPFIPPGSKF